MDLEQEWLQKAEDWYSQDAEQKEEENLLSVMRKNRTDSVISLKTKKDINNIFEKGKVKYTDGIGIRIVKNGENYNRFVIIPLHGYGNAVERNKVKRRIREILRNYSFCMDKGYDIAVIIKKTEQNTNFNQLKNKVMVLLNRFKILNEGIIKS